eukprot:TRINITY_DN8112_c0_g1_i1.p1 TRINITY_DN8112_c0_g1~~TRINITY_DN8112_c0_g1_i1.p1  ORF type:complete len:260 (+),score=4.39 TRINITY_DN8112_c0_g1_i1:67-780(+)
MYCDDTVLCLQHSTVVTSALELLDEFAAMSGLRINRSKCTIIDNADSNLQFDVPTREQVLYLGFSFDKNGIVNLSCKFLQLLPSKYHETKQLRLSPIGMSQFTNSYILSKSTFWSQCETYSTLEWKEADMNIHKFRFGKASTSDKVFPPMALHKSLFPTSRGGFNMWLPSIRSKAVIVALFIHCIQHSEILKKIIYNESFLCINSTVNPSDALTTNSNWPWLRSAVSSINQLELTRK